MVEQYAERGTGKGENTQILCYVRVLWSTDSELKLDIDKNMSA